MKISITRILACAAALLCLSFALISCSDDPADEDGDETKLRISPYAGNNQSERVGAPLADPLVVKVTDILGNVKPGIAITFTAQTAGAVVTPAFAATDADGLASCTLRLGSTAGAYQVRAVMQDDSTTFTATAVPLACPEENPGRRCQWPTAHIFIMTRGSTLLAGAGSVIIDYNPTTGEIEKVLETTDLLDGISFSSYGELFVSSSTKIRKVRHDTKELESYLSSLETDPMAMEPNPGGVLAGLWQTGPLRIGCPPDDLELIAASYSGVEWMNIAVDPVKRDFHMITRYGVAQFNVWRFNWDGRSPAQGEGVLRSFTVANADPAGMCSDSTGTLYIVFDGNDTFRRIVTVAADGTFNDRLFDFYSHGGNNQAAGRWGDIAYLDGKLYLIDKRNDRLVIISKDGEWLGEVANTAFSRPGDESEHYAICASPNWICITSPGAGTHSSRR